MEINYNTELHFYKSTYLDEIAPELPSQLEKELNLEVRIALSSIIISKIRSTASVLLACVASAKSGGKREEERVLKWKGTFSPCYAGYSCLNNKNRKL